MVELIRRPGVPSGVSREERGANCNIGNSGPPSSSLVRAWPSTPGELLRDVAGRAVALGAG